MSKITELMRRGIQSSFLCFTALLAPVALSVSADAFAAPAPRQAVVSRSAKGNGNVATRTKGVKNTFATPDFAFPKTVEENARPKLDAALAARDGKTALQAAVQLDIAASLVSQSSFATSATLFDSIAESVPEPWSNLSLLIEATMYAQLYGTQPWTFNGRRIPSKPVPDNVMEWSRQMFDDKISELVEKSLVDSDPLAAVPLSQISALLTDSKDAEKAGFSVLDFMTLKAVDLLGTFGYDNAMQTIPFGKAGAAASTPKIRAISLLEQAACRHASDSDKFAEAYFCNARLRMLSGDAALNYAHECAERFGDTPYAAQFITDYCSRLTPEKAGVKTANELRKIKYDLLSQYKKRFHDAYGIGAVESMLNAMTAKTAEVTFPNRILPGRTDSVSVNGSGIYDLNVLIFALRGNKAPDNLTYASLKNSGKLTASVPVKVEGAVPDEFSCKVALPALNPGVYALVPSVTADASGILASSMNNSVSTMLVSGIDVVRTSSATDGSRQLYVVSAENGRPVASATVKLYKITSGHRGAAQTLTADRNGMVLVPAGTFDYEVTAEGSFASGRIYRGGTYYGDSKAQLRGALLTDLSIYHPGDKVGFTGILYTAEDKQLKAAPERDAVVLLKDANWQTVDSIAVKSDNYGRFDATATLPEQGLLGSWQLVMMDGDNWTANTSFQVADYKSPTFYVTIDGAKGSYKAGDTLKFNGSAMTYAGMPVAGGKVAYTVEYAPVWWRSEGSGASYGGETVTGADGSFVIELPTAGLEGTPFRRGGFVLKTAVTDAAGETREAETTRFSLGDELHIMADIPARIEAGTDSVACKVAVNDVLGHPVIKKVYYEISRGGKTVGSGDFESPSLRLDVRNLESGRYALRFSLNSDFRGNEQCDVTTDSVTIWRSSDVRPAEQTSLWVDRTRVVLPSGDKKVRLRVGSSYPDSYVLAVISDSRRVIGSEWIKVSEGFSKITVDAPSDDEQVFVTLYAVRDLSAKSQTVCVVPYAQTITLKPVAETFRDKVTPGARETWRFRFDLYGKPQPDLPVMAVMTNKALNTLAPFSWSFNPASSLYWSAAGQISFYNPYSVSNSIWSGNRGSVTDSPRFDVPGWQTYGYMLVSGSEGGYVRNMLFKSSANSIRIRGTSYLLAEEAVEEVAADMAAPEAVFATGGKAEDKESSDAGQAADETPLRRTDCPLAFFMPKLTTGADGTATIEFTAPDFVGTWQLQVLGYTPAMQGGVMTLDAVSAKKVMTQLNAPRFVRTGDFVTVSATIYNNSDTDQPVEGRFELVNAVTGQTLLKSDFGTETVRASGSRVIYTELRIPSEIEGIVVKAIGSIPGYSDGEQTLVPVLPSSTPVTESTPFYIPAGSNSYSVTLPTFDKDAKVTLSYCDNPVWECVTALPSVITPSSVNILAQVHALFGNSVASGLFARYPELVKGVKALASDSALVSPLVRDSQLKNVALVNTPWVNDAASETLRMHSLVKYADPSVARGATDAIMKTLTDRQNRDGGWSWCPDMESSEFITSEVVRVLGNLQSMGYLPEGGESLARKGCEYVDRKLAEAWNRSGRKDVPLITLLYYLYDKSAFKGIGSTSAFAPLDRLAIKKITSEWKNFSIRDKATAALLLWRRGDATTPRLILESLRQYASESPEKGMWYDNLNSGWNGSDPLLTTARVLEAWYAVEPKNPAVDKLRQWLVVSKQTQNWGDDTRTAEAINALLVSGSQWTASAAPAVVTLNGTPVTFGAASAQTGSITVNLNPAAASGAELRVERTAAGPAWGGVLAQYIALIEDVKAASVPQLSVVKNVYKITSGADGVTASAGSLKTGDRVRVTMTLTCDRDLDYVSVTDARAACLEPADQISGYTAGDGVWFYREVRDSSTNLFIPFLPKGTHVISYECFVDREGEYSLGITAAQSQYAPTVTAHSAGATIEVTTHSVGFVM